MFLCQCHRNAGVQWSIDFNPHPRAWHVVSDDIIYAGSEMNVDTDEFLKSLKSLQVSPVRVPGEEPGPGLPNQHAKACPRFQTMHCWCPPATGPGQPHESDCFQYTRPEPETESETAKWAGISKFESGPFFGHGLQYQAKISAMQAQAYNHALRWLAKQNPAPLALATTPMTHSIECTCAAQYGVIGHAAFCPLGEKAESDACNSEPDAANFTDPQELAW